MIWFTADTHFNHKNIIKYCNRPYKTVEEMNEDIIKNWADNIKDEDLVYHLGDFGFGNLSNILDKLTGKIYLVKGSHDKNTFQYKHKFAAISPLMEINVEKTSIILCHYAMRVWSKSHYNSWHLYGHSHGMLAPTGKSWDVGVDNNGFKPVSFEQIKEIMSKRPDNFNLVK